MAVELATAYVSIVPTFKNIKGNVTKGLAGVDHDFENAGRKSGEKFKAGFSKVKVGSFLAVAGLGALAKSAISTASDVSESTSKVGVVFGRFSQQIIDQSRHSAEAMGLSEGAYLEATGTLGNLLVSLKLAPERAADMSQQFVKLAGDLASFNNVSPEEALLAIKSGLTGETEPLKRFGVNMNDATLRAQALKLGLIKTVKDGMTPQTKALAASALIMDQTKTAQGDFARTSGGLANQQRILAAQFTDMKARLGRQLLPIAVKVARFFSGPFALGLKAMISAFQEGDVTSDGFVGVMERVGVTARSFVSWTRKHWPQIKAVFVAVATAVIGALQSTLGVVKSLVPAFQAVFGFLLKHKDVVAAFAVTLGVLIVAWKTYIIVMKLAAAAQALFNAVLLANPIGLVIIALAALTAGAIYAYTHSEKFRVIVQAAWQGIQLVVAAVWPYLKRVFELLVQQFKLTGEAALWLWHNAIQPAASGIAAAVKAVSTVFRSIGVGLQWAWDNGLSQLFGAILAALREIRDLMDAITDNALTKGLNTIGVGKSGSIGGNISVPGVTGDGGVGSDVTTKGFIPRAFGGPVVKGRSYVVGDGGRPELFVPNQNGRIEPRVPTEGRTGDVHIEQNIYNPLPEVASVSAPLGLRRAAAALAGY